MGNSPAIARSDGTQSTLTAGEVLTEYDENIINRGTLGRPKPLLKFHSVCGANIQLLRDCRVARRKESFCKGLAFSNRPISIDEIVCIRLCEVGTNWSGVMRFGVTNVDPASFRDIELPKFACPDLTSKGGYWAKSLAERYSVEGSILHFFINESGEMYYGVNGVHKGLFLSGINVLNPLWIIVDIYGNSVAVEFIDPSDVQLQTKQTPVKHRVGPAVTTGFHSGSAEGSPFSRVTPASHQQLPSSMTASNSANNLLNVTTTANSSQSPSSRASPIASKMRFHSVKGVNVYLQHDETVAVRKHGEYYQGYVFTERPIRAGEKLIVLIGQVEDAFSGSLAFGLTSCDPTEVPASRLPVDSDELLERPEYWVCIKDVGAMPQVGDKLSFQVDTAGRVFFSKNDAPPRVVMHVDMSIPLWMFFDLYGSTRKIQLLDLDIPVNTLSIMDMSRNLRASSEGACCGQQGNNRTTAMRKHLEQSRPYRPSSTQWNMDSLRVALPAESSSSTSSAIAIQPETVVLPIPASSAPSLPSATGASSSAPSSTTPPFSSYLNLDDTAELARIRANIAMRRLNRDREGQQPTTTGRGDGPSQTGTTGLFSTTSPFLLDPPQPITTNSSSISNTTTSGTTINSGDSALSRSPPSLTELLANRRSQLEARMAALAALRDTQSPIRDDSSAYSQRNLLASILDTPRTNTVSTAASVSAPLLPPSLFSSTEISERESRRSRRHYLPDLGSSDDSSPNRRDDEAAAEGDRQQDNGGTGQQGTECAICMNNRVNAVIYRCGHMCMCFACAKETHRRSGDCPICRTPIIDVIRCYPG